ncbi:MAG: DUF86 domain-containing protein [FCB group bacterium]|nr:DUF86 domain-containing protein [FCB group bacterium]
MLRNIRYLHCRLERLPLAYRRHGYKIDITYILSNILESLRPREPGHLRPNLTPGLGKKLNAPVGFRNIAVLEYQNLDPAILQVILAKHLKDLEAYYRTILKYCGL